jgi:hypothetical protein
VTRDFLESLGPRADRDISQINKADVVKYRDEVLTRTLPVAIEDNSDVAPPAEHVAEVWGKLDQEDFSHLDKR